LFIDCIIYSIGDIFNISAILISGGLNMAPVIHIGTSGWHYKHWRGIFYPEKLARKDWLKYYAEQFSTVEINASFYRLPSESTFANWRQNVPQTICFAVKSSRFITHIKRLKDVQEPLLNFTDRAKLLKNKLGPVLYQLPPNFHRDETRLEEFLATLDKSLKYVFEFRHSSWFDDVIFKLLRRYDAGFCIFDMPALTSPVTATADFGYMRFHGAGELYSGNYADSKLEDWAKKLHHLARDLNVLYVYFNTMPVVML